MTKRHPLPSKRKSYPVMMMGLLLAVSLLLINQHSDAALGIANPKHEQAMLWPLLPGESVNTLAAKLYPQSPVLQQRFVQQSITLSRSRGILLRPDERSDTAQLIAVPNAQTLHTLTHRIKKADEIDTEAFVTPGLVMSVQLTQDAQHSSWRWPKLTLPTLHLPEGLFLKGYSISFEHLAERVTALKSHIVETYQANTRAIARTPMKQLYQTPQLAVIVVSAILLLGLSLVWGILEERRDKR
jgi:hypothetical protein